MLYEVITIKPDFVHILEDGKIIKSGDASLAQQINEKGFQKGV